MNESPFFSIITVVLNDASGLESTIASVDDQVETDWLHIIVDGASTDRTARILEKAKSRPRTVLVSEPDGGIYDAMNKGLKLAPGEGYVIFLNAADSFCDPDTLLQLRKSIEANRFPDWVQGRHVEHDPKTSTSYCRLVATPSVENQLYATGFRSHQATLMKAEFIKNLGGFDENFSVAADWDLIVRAHRKCPPFDSNLVIATFNLGGFSASRMVQAHAELRRIRERELLNARWRYILDDIWMSLALYPLGFKNYFTPILSLYVSLRSSRRVIYSGLRSARRVLYAILWKVHKIARTVLTMIVKNVHLFQRKLVHLETQWVQKCRSAIFDRLPKPVLPLYRLRFPEFAKGTGIVWEYRVLAALLRCLGAKSVHESAGKR